MDNSRELLTPSRFTISKNNADINEFLKIRDKCQQLREEVDDLIKCYPFLIEVDMSEILYTPDESKKQRYAVMVDPLRMRTVAEFGHKIQDLFDLKQNVICLQGDLIFPDRESIEALVFIKTQVVRVCWRGSPVVQRPLQSADIPPLAQKSVSQPLGETKVGESSEEHCTVVLKGGVKTPLSRVKYPSKVFSVGEFLSNLRRKETKEESETGPGASATDEPSGDSFYLKQPPKRKRVRKHKSKKAKLSEEVAFDPPPVLPAVPFTFEKSSLQSSHIRFSEEGEPEFAAPEEGEPEMAAPEDGESEMAAPEEGELEMEAPEEEELEMAAPEEENPELTAPEEGEIVAKGACSTTPLNCSVTDMTGDLQAIFSLKKLHGSAPVFMRTPAPTHSA